MGDVFTRQNVAISKFDSVGNALKCAPDHQMKRLIIDKFIGTNYLMTVRIGDIDNYLADQDVV